MSNLNNRLSKLEQKRQSADDLAGVRWEDFIRRDFVTDEDITRAANILQQFVNLGVHPDTVSPDEWLTMLDEVDCN